MATKATSPGEAQAAFRRLIETQTDDCILWPYALNGNGYGLVAGDTRMEYVHRLACERGHGPQPFDGAYAAHSCRNRHCFNPLHLRWATPSENQLDRHRDGTASIGAKNGMTKLSEDDVREIRRRRHQGDPIASVAHDFSVSIATVSRVANRRLWKWLD